MSQFQSIKIFENREISQQSYHRATHPHPKAQECSNVKADKNYATEIIASSFFIHNDKEHPLVRFTTSPSAFVNIHTKEGAAIVNRQ